MSDIKDNYITGIGGLLVNFFMSVLYYITGSFKAIIEPIDKMLQGRWGLVVFVLALVGLYVGSKVKVKYKWV